MSVQPTQFAPSSRSMVPRPPSYGNTEHFTKVADLTPGQKGLNMMVIILERGTPTKTSSGNLVIQFLVADATGSVYLSLWDEKTETLQPGDIIQLRAGYATLFKHTLMVYAGKHGVVERVGEFCMIFSEYPNMSAFEWIEDPQTKLWTRAPSKQQLPRGT